MLDKKKSLIIFVLIIIVMLTIGIILILKKDKVDRVKNMYNNICKNQNFTFTMFESTLDHNKKTIISQKGVDTCMDMYSKDEHYTILVIDGQAYSIMHDREEYLSYDEEEADGDTLISILSELQGKEYVNGREKINGKDYYFEEFEGASYYSSLIENLSIKTRFYFDGDNLVYIKYINEDNEEELVKTTLEYSIQEEMFKIPENYAEGIE